MKIRFCLLIIAIALTFAMSLTAWAQKSPLPVLHKENLKPIQLPPATIDGIEYEVFEINAPGFKLPVRFIFYAQKGIDVPEGIMNFFNPDNTVFKNAVMSCFSKDFNCEVFEIVVTKKEVNRMTISTMNLVHATGDKIPTTRISINLPMSLTKPASLPARSRIVAGKPITQNE